jgi:hypothetical protein
MKTNFKKLLLTLSLVTLVGSASSLASASDLSNDLRTSFAPLSNPFEHSAEKPLPAAVATILRNLLARCAYTPVQAPNASTSNTVYFDASLEKGCESEIIASYVNDKNGHKVIGNRLFIHSQGLALQVVSWDGSQSDGGDEQAIGIYDIYGNRVAVYPALYVIGNALDGIAHAVGANLKTR